MNKEEKQIMGLISISGDSRSKAFEALEKVKTGDYKKARSLIAESKQSAVNAHNIQTKMIQEDLQNKDDHSGLLMIHAQDHYMTAQLARDLIEELIKIFESKEKKGD